MSRKGFVLMSLLSTLVGVSLAHAGNNAGGSAYLSWDVAGQVPVLPRPVAQPFPLYLHLVGASDVHALAVTLRWAPWDSLGACYTAVSGSPDDNCGSGTNTSPGGGFAGDTTYTWSIQFSPGATKNCVTYWFSNASCDSAPPAKFVIAAVAVLDANGAVDTLSNIGDAKLSGGAGADTSWWSSSKASPPSQAAAFSVFLRPNPTTGEVRLDVQMPTAQTIHLGIYDLAGRAVRQIEQGGRLNTGLHRYRWDLKDADGRRVPSGIYFARAASSQGSQLVRIVVVK